MDPAGLSRNIVGPLVSSSKVVRRSWFILSLLVSGCAASSTGGGVKEPSAEAKSAPSDSISGQAGEQDGASLIAAAERALVDQQPARAAALFARVLGRASEGRGEELLRQAYPGLARAHEQLGDFDAAIRAYNGFLANFERDPEVPRMLARRGACEAELGQWQRSAASYASVLERGNQQLLPSQRVEALARQGFALYHLGEHEQADAIFAEADEIYESATRSGEERFADTYFVAMARFYRAAILHLRFRELPVRLPEAQMAKDFEAKLAVLEQAQEAYNHVIAARHMYWVSAAGYQLGSLLEEFYDALMYAPVPEWLDEAQRRTYYEELEEQLRPVVDKAVWVFEKNLETARKLGYESEFIDQTERRLAQLQAIMLGRGDHGEPVPRLAPIEARPAPTPDAAATAEDLPAVERKLFVPMPTTI